jgi:hypothetical protein
MKLKGKPDPITELRGALQIDRDSLDEEMLRQPFLYLRVSEEYVLAASQRDAAKEELARTDAQLAAVYRKKAAKAAERTSEQKIGDLVIQDDAHISAHEAFADAKRRADTLYALKESYDQRGKMLRELGSLYVSGYFDRVTVKGGETAVKDAKASMAKTAWRKRRAQGDDE